MPLDRALAIAADASFDFRLATRRIIHGWDSRLKLRDLAQAHGRRRAVLAMDAFFAGSEVARALGAHLAAVLEAPPVFHWVPMGEPTTAEVDACFAVLRAEVPDLIVAIGGGSAMDAVKVARMMLANGTPAERFAGFGRVLKAHDSLLVCLPTTAGTGAEVSEYAIIGKHDAPVKLRFNAAELAADIAILDPALTVSAPPSVTASAGYDAITHAVEGFVSRWSSLLSDPLHISALGRLIEWLPVAHAEPAHRRARSECLVAACLTGIAFNSTALGMAHAISAPLGNRHGVPHGLANALALPAVMAFNTPAIPEKAATIAALLRAPAAAEGLAELRLRLGLDLGLDRFVADAAERDSLAEAAMTSGNMQANPRTASLSQVRGVIEAMRR